MNYRKTENSKRYKPQNAGFSLTEVLMATGILVIGFMLIAGTFPVGVKLTSLSTERSIGLVAANEAAAKIELYGLNPNVNTFWLDSNRMTPLMYHQLIDTDTITTIQNMDPPGNRTLQEARHIVEQQLETEGFYPSTPTLWNLEKPKYFWSALCRRGLVSNSKDVELTIFVGHKTGANVVYPRAELVPDVALGRITNWVPLDLDGNPRANTHPRSVPILVQRFYNDPAPDEYGFTDEIMITDDPSSGNPANVNEDQLNNYIKEGSILVDEYNGQIMRVLERNLADFSIKLLPLTNKTTDLGDNGLFQYDERPGFAIPEPRYIWVMPPAINDRNWIAAPLDTTPPNVSGRNPCVTVKQDNKTF